jgi:cysteine desulfurase
MADALGAPAGDPGRLHEEGRQARGRLEAARQDLARLLGVRPRQVVLTSGGTEAVNAATWGASRARPGAPVLLAAVEHSAVRAASERAGPVEHLAVDPYGRLDLDGLEAALARPGPTPALVHCQWANHEVGSLQPVAEVVARCAAADVPVHVDAVAAFGQVPLDLGALGADLVSISAHKAGGPTGIGALVVRRGLRVAPFVVGGAQERARRAGIENLVAAEGLGALARSLGADEAAPLVAEAARARALVARLLDGALALPGLVLVGDPAPGGRLPHVVCLGVEGVEAEPVLLGLDRAGVAVHSGSACAAEAFEPSPVLEAMGADPSRSLRVSVGWSSTDEDIAAFVGALGAVVGDLRALRA